ncbi:TetR/AcrR family transcriptional regulator [Granulicella arctica]|uniref:TetR/AcrR family transcriptional regulator n=1 Tax=Granulicella arctica TaxID=940613 RepID=UPI0021DF9A07|nr:TetR/AcrR family transcriptional regulator [Granulicella arctica]
MRTNSKLPAADRRQAIMTAAAPVFARLGRSGTTTKDLAKAAGVSEALLYRHFPGKDALYAELESHCVEANALGVSLIEGATPSTATLVMGVAVLVQAVFPGIGARQSHEDTKRLVTSSLVGDGRFAKAFLDRHVKPWVGLFEKSLDAARAAGDVEEGISTGKAEIWFVHHLANTLHLIRLPENDVVDYGMTQERLTESAVRFLLRGLGLKNTAINRHYDPKELKSILARIGQE